MLGALVVTAGKQVSSSLPLDYCTTCKLVGSLHFSSLRRRVEFFALSRMALNTTCLLLYWHALFLYYCNTKCRKLLSRITLNTTCLLLYWHALLLYYCNTKCRKLLSRIPFTTCLLLYWHSTISLLL